MNKNSLLWIVLVVAILVGVYLIFSSASAPGDSTNAPANNTPQTVNPPVNSGITTGDKVPSTGKVQIDAKGFAFVSKTVRVAPGTTITWKNFDDVAHQVIGPDFSSPVLLKGQTYSHRFTKEGIFSYYCGLHPNMNGEVVVRN